MSLSLPLSLKLLISTPSPSSVFSYLPSDGTVWFIGRGWLKDPLLLLRRQRGVEWDDFHVTDFGTQVIDLPLDPLTGFVDFLKDGESATFNSGVACRIKQTPGETMEASLDDVIGGCLLQYICSCYRSI